MPNLQYISNIASSEKIGNSLVKINNNFVNLNEALCSIKNKFDSRVVVRTFFYYGPNSGTDPTSGMQDSVASLPSNVAIEKFVNNTSYLNLPSVSRLNDQVYVIYQKTGVYLPTLTRIGSKVYAGGVASWATPDTYATYSPLFVIWKLVAENNLTATLNYKIQTGFPKFSQAETISSPNWNNPVSWTEY
jgi:hypothetical protein